MRSLSASDILQIWELGLCQHPLQRAVTILTVAFPEMSAEEVASLTIGERDGYLLRLREWTFGTGMKGFAACPQCSDRLEFTLDVADIRVGDNQPIESEYRLSYGEIELQFRLPNSRDLAAIASCNNPIIAQQRLIQRCVLQAKQDGAILGTNELSEEAIAQLAKQMAKCDPQAEIMLDFTCPGCNYQWQTLFDITAFFWSEIAAFAKRLLREVHTLAKAYGWREADILAMSHQRRQFYLEMVGL
ncbi:T4 family baseplate hub assembly chaperone [Microseira wollei]|uniref:Phage baseplate protein n=1 Tax=Microseira wollei NIES-4236 TaxID=2530354 RepID=A0AAV3XIE5_9CYAN|nr:phage baseplate protein [Microseira wollei]GET39207.1 hypothetical protein MiSe_39710 [Microseira wollei NIES-4236]